MKTLVKPTTIPYLITFDGNRKINMCNEEGEFVNTTPIGEWFCCKAVVDKKKCVVFFDNSFIRCLPINEEKVFIDYLFSEHINIGISVILYSKCFSDFSNNGFEFER